MTEEESKTGTAIAISLGFVGVISPASYLLRTKAFIGSIGSLSLPADLYGAYSEPNVAIQITNSSSNEIVVEATWALARSDTDDRRTFTTYCDTWVRVPHQTQNVWRIKKHQHVSGPAVLWMDTWKSRYAVHPVMQEAPRSVKEREGKKYEALDDFPEGLEAAWRKRFSPSKRAEVLELTQRLSDGEIEVVWTDGRKAHSAAWQRRNGWELNSTRAEKL